MSSKQFPKGQKPNTGNLLYNGKVIMENKLFPILQAEKKKLLATGYYIKELFKITYYYGKNR
jgi:hypothetical protein